MARGRWVVVSGAAGGMGRAVADRLVRDGFEVLALVHHEEALTSWSAPQVHPIVVELTDTGVGDTCRDALEALGATEVFAIVNVAGVSRGAAIADITDADWAYSMDVNVTAPMRLVRALVDRIPAGGTIINVGSPVSLVGARKVSYSASKGALLGLNAALAKGLGSRGVRVNAILPGATITKMTADWDTKKQAAVAAGTLLGRLCQPEDIAGAVAFLIGPDASFITGTVLNVTGGAVMGAH